MSAKQISSGTSSGKRIVSGANRFAVTEEDIFVNIVDEEEDDMNQQANTSTAISSPRTRRINAGSSGMEHHQMLMQSDFEGGLIDPVDQIGMEMEGYGEDEEFYVDEEEGAYIPAGNMAEFEMIEDSFHVYDQLPSNLIICDLCESRPVFANRDQFNTHRYQRHGSIVSVCACPDFECDQVFASIGTIKRHLAVDHNLPLETHFKKFDGITEFSEWIVYVQYATDTRFVMHNRQQPKRRQLLFCVFSDHRKSNSRRTGMLKSKGCCPAHVNYTINPDGTVEVIYQMYHHGHDPKAVDVEAIKPWSLAKANRENRCKVLFPSKPLIMGCRPMQYVQIDIIEMPETKYRHGTKYSNALVVTDMFSKFMFGRSLIDGDENDQEHVVCRLLIEIFSAFGLPEGYSAVFGKDTIDRCICQVSENFRTEIQSVTSSTPCYAALRRNIELKAESDLKDKLRWPESLPATILTTTKPHMPYSNFVSLHLR
uniref:C2H2-type domain-containing protein n=1 Tax=Ditylenchus dipsaci TaxID=166011 RepID=A0A915DEW8_9BILA